MVISLDIIGCIKVLIINIVYLFNIYNEGTKKEIYYIILLVNPFNMCNNPCNSVNKGIYDIMGWVRTIIWFNNVL